MKKYKGFKGSGMNDDKISKTAKMKNITNLMRDYMTSKATQEQKQAIVTAAQIANLYENQTNKEV